ncbi:MAG: hypothetical protein H0T42_09150 [Deltaproteobacteria bacterium]|nr:hypothetical protein [Deltaproteobacteria bacterium]
MLLAVRGLALVSLSMGCGRLGFDATEDLVEKLQTCRDVQRSGLPTGRHTLDPDADGPLAPRDVWCDLERRGGGWTLAMKVEGSQPTFLGTSPLWGDTSLVNPASLDPEVRDEAKLAPFVDEPVAEVMLVVDAGSDAVFRVRGTSLRALFASGLTFPTATAETEVRTAFANPTLQNGCRRQGVGLTNQPSNNSPREVRIGLITNDEVDDCETADSLVGVGINYLCDSGSTVSAGTIANLGPPGVCQAQRVLVYIRGDDQTRFPSLPSCAAHLARGRTDDGVYLVGGLRRRCDMTTDGGGWTNALDFDGVRDPCPAPWEADPTSFGLCIVPGTVLGVAGVVIPSPLASYREAMATATGFQRGSTDAFEPPLATLDNAYVDGLSITSGSPRQHVATFAAGHGAIDACPTPTGCNCPCDGGEPAPAFVPSGSFRCEPGSLVTLTPGMLSRPDPLFDGAEVTAACAAEARSEPIRTTLPAPTSANLEARLMRDEPAQGEGIALYRCAVWVR